MATGGPRRRPKPGFARGRPRRPDGPLPLRNPFARDGVATRRADAVRGLPVFPDRCTGIMTMHRIPIVLARTGVLLTAVFVLAGASARTANFDGRWSVLVITESGTCDAAYRYGVAVENGVVRYRGESGID